ncbi:hypothetical protein BGZ82_003910, partial [Podila clonocystis]
VTSQALSVEIDHTKTVDGLKKLIKTEKAPRFDDVAADELTLWSVSIPDDGNNDLPISLGSVLEKRKLKATSKLSKVFDAEPPDDTIHVLVQHPLPVHLPVPAHVSTSLSGYLSDQSRPGTPLSGNRRRIFFGSDLY